MWHSLGPFVLPRPATFKQKLFLLVLSSRLTIKTCAGVTLAFAIAGGLKSLIDWHEMGLGFSGTHLA